MVKQITPGENGLEEQTVKLTWQAIIRYCQRQGKNVVKEQDLYSKGVITFNQECQGRWG